MSTDNRRTRYVAEYLYPGSLFPEETSRELDEPTLKAALDAQPDDEDGWFRRDAWYALRIKSWTEKRYIADDGDITWVSEQDLDVHSYIVGEPVHVDDIPDTDNNAILKANIRGNSKGEPVGVRTRIGNWQIASDWDVVLSADEIIGGAS